MVHVRHASFENVDVLETLNTSMSQQQQQQASKQHLTQLLNDSPVARQPAKPTSTCKPHASHVTCDTSLQPCLYQK